MSFIWWLYGRWLMWLGEAIGWELDPEEPEDALSDDDVILFDDVDT